MNRREREALMKRFAHHTWRRAGGRDSAELLGDPECLEASAEA